MLHSKTVLVIGAGGSSEVGLPIGLDLAAQISKALDFKVSYGHRNGGGDNVIYEALQQNASKQQLGAMVSSCKRIRNGLALAPSIDTFIDIHKDDQALVFCGKLAIVRCILLAESASAIFTGENGNPQIDFESISKTWFVQFFKILTKGVSRTQVETAFANLSINNFNYDRCVEQFFVHALSALYGVQHNDSSSIVAGAHIYHPYGTVGKLPLAVRGGANPIRFGEISEFTDIRELTKDIKTYTEQIEQSDDLVAAKTAIQSADLVIFLGFAFHRQNMELIMPEKPTRAAAVYGTAYGISKDDQVVIERQVQEFFSPSAGGLKLRLRDMKCGEFLAQFHHSIVSGI